MEDIAGTGKSLEKHGDRRLVISGELQPGRPGRV